MNDNLGKMGDEPSIEWVKRRLRDLSATKASESLRDRLFAGIPPAALGKPIAHRFLLWPQGIRWGTVAAVLIVGSVLVWFGTFGRLQVRPVAEANSSLGQTYASDHNSLRVSDTNLCDINGLR